MSYSKRLKRLLSHFFDERYIVFGSKHKHKNIRISKTTFIFLFALISCSLISSAYLIADFVAKRIALYRVYSEIAELKEVNNGLHGYLEEVNAELKSFAGYVNIPSKKPDDSNKKSHVNNAATKMDVVNESLAVFYITMNNRLSSIVKQIKNTGIHPLNFVKEQKDALDKIGILSSKEFKEGVSQVSKYDYAKKYYYFRSAILDKKLGSTIANKFIPEKLQQQVSVLQKLESVLASIPFGNPMRGKYFVSSRFGPRLDPVTRSRISNHMGIDLVGHHNSEVYSSGNGIVKIATVMPTMGNVVLIEHGNNIYSKYAHLGKINVKVGEKVDTKTVLGHQGSTGSRCTGSHLHYELLYNNKNVDPANFVFASRVPLAGRTALAAAKTTNAAAN